jgi:AraC family transcriptional regulator, regulatory protein of adaptative response / methylated-DNA-[protein]-cysteine methyltransferase
MSTHITTNAILVSDQISDPFDMPTETQKWQAVLDRNATEDGQFVYAVVTTGVYCRPSCASRRPLRANVQFFDNPVAAEQSGFRACLRCRPQAAAHKLDGRSANVRAVCRYIERHLDEPISLHVLGHAFDMSPFHLQRTFKAALGITPKEYADSCRMNQLKRNLQSGKNVAHALYEAGYSSSSRLYERASQHLGMTPDKYRRGAIGVAIRFTTSASPLGRLLIAATDQGICAIRFGDNDSDLELGLRREYPFAARKRQDDDLQGWSRQVLQHLEGHKLNNALPLDIQATAFQRKVWTYLQTIPRGATQSYSEVARAIGRPTAARAVARACATNSVALEIPCHRVVREDGGLGGYRWGIQRKQKLLQLEKAAAAAV